MSKSWPRRRGQETRRVSDAGNKNNTKPGQQKQKKKSGAQSEFHIRKLSEPEICPQKAL